MKDGSTNKIDVEKRPARKTVSFIPVRASFDAASRSQEAHRHWRGADALSADAALSPDVRHLIISRARYEVANNGYVCGILNTLPPTTASAPARDYSLSLCDCSDESLADAMEIARTPRKAVAGARQSVFAGS